jgi:CheY-like chemotaxis protein
MSPKAAPGREDRHHVVLVVEDEILMRSVTAESLRIAGYNVVEAANAAEAVAVFTAGTVIDLVFSDINFMAGPNSMDAVGLARWVSRPGKMAAI